MFATFHLQDGDTDGSLTLVYFPVPHDRFHYHYDLTLTTSCQHPTSSNRLHVPDSNTPSGSTQTTEKLVCGTRKVLGSFVMTCVTLLFNSDDTERTSVRVRRYALLITPCAGGGMICGARTPHTSTQTK